MDDRTDKEILDMLYTWTRTLVPAQARFIDELAALEPEIQPLIAEHIRDNDELLPTVLMGDIARWVGQVVRDSPNPRSRLAPFFARLEAAWEDNGGPVSELIAVSFVENVYDNPAIVQLLGPNLAHYHRVYTGQEKPRNDQRRPVPEIVQQIRKKLGWS
ncbi:hypothetical protein NBRGN_057_03130 [Nocardia brasiliensis NBRC 14402]|uniref:DUF7674 family protein n=1 Tax=Nocardia brasiliensis TaxID=37326 RepID=UPI00045C560F|nr:hypothetical protein [Nocardia brasiliensis]ASF11697.1 hypothetical protein CEQ30_35050 [Nocardia brasiliensis]GAJ82806.1 hypothetical protein NBRGN_057_03130 [Nocardia brasiliensis NBRC 14402]SUB09497.1 Uncharacterised protein [Nocardia brasiliensis]